MGTDVVMADLLMEWEERHEEGRPATPEELCRAHPERLPELRQRIGLLQAIGSILSLDDDDPEVSGYEVLDLLGEGGMGVVYQARDTGGLGRLVAIKLPREGLLASAAARERFVREARVLGALRHPNIVTIHHADLHHGRPYFVMDYVAGGSLAAQLARFAAAPREAAELVAKVARAVHHAHQRGVLHRDLKPSNILLDEQGEPLVSDFGIASVLGPGCEIADGDHQGPTPEPTGLTATGVRIGTPPYMAPEQCDPSLGPVGPAVDVWALGVVLYQLLTGELPRHGDGDRLPRLAVCKVDRRLAAIVRKCLAQAPADRFASAEALADALAGWFRPRRLGGMIRRGVLCAATALAALLAAVPPPRGRPAPRAEGPSEVERALAELSAGKAVDLIRGKGLPIGHTLRAGGAARVGLDKEGTFTVYAPEVALVELLPDSRVERYRLTAEVRQIACLRPGDVGLYFAHQRLDTAQGEAHLFGRVRFADLGPSARASVDKKGQRGSRFFLEDSYYREPGVAEIRWAYSGPSQWYKPPTLAPAAPSVWRGLEVTVTPETITARMGDIQLPAASRKFPSLWASALPRMLPELRGQAVHRTRRGALGLYVNGGRAVFRHVRVTPLPSP